MAGNTNDQIQFENIGPRMLYATRYEDSQGNVWRIVAQGEPSVVSAFTSQPELLLVAEPLNGDRTLPEATPQPPMDGNEYGNLPAPDNFFDYPDLELKIELVEAAIPRPFRVAFVMDPCIQSYKSWAQWFSLPGDTYLQFRYSANYSVTVSAVGGSNYGSSSGTSGTVGCAGSGSWTVIVKNNTANNNCFSLSGEINVY